MDFLFWQSGTKGNVSATLTGVTRCQNEKDAHRCKIIEEE